MTCFALAARSPVGLVAAIVVLGCSAPPQLPPVLAGASFESGAARIGAVEIALASYGRVGAMRSVEPGRACRDADEIHIPRAPGVLEWWREVPGGLEQGVTISARPEGRGALVLSMRVGEGTRAEGSGDRIALVGPSGELATYSGLVVLDATGATVPARMHGDGGHIVIDVDDAAARYPLVVDPIVVVTEATLNEPVPGDSDDLGAAVALSGAGDWLVAGDPESSPAGGPGNAGSATVFSRSGTTWSRSALLVASDRENNDRFGASVALSADGAFALVGAPDDNASVGTVRVWSRVGTLWTAAATLVPAAPAGRAFGASVALTADASRAIVGMPSDLVGGIATGSARIFARSAATWTEEVRLTFSGGSSGDYVGNAVSIDLAGGRVAVGAPYRTLARPSMPLVSGAGSVRIFVRTGTTWSEESELVAPAPAFGGRFGAAVALSSGGDRLVVGAPGASAGAVFVFGRTGTGWTLEATLPGGSMDALGTSVAIDGAGARVVAGAPNATNAMGRPTGVARVFERAGTTWSPEATLFHVFATNSARHGATVALSAAGARAAVGAPEGGLSASADLGTASVYRLALRPGGTCAAPSECESGFCVDGVCCSTVCAGGATDCQACSVAAGAAVDGTCGPLSTTTAPMIVCRGARGACDREERCVAGDSTCPGDTRFPGGTPCRTPVGDCDSAESCDGLSDECAGDVLLGATVTCRPSISVCDVEERCSGTATTCPADAFAPDTAPCGPPAAGLCDLPDHCAGTSSACAVEFALAGTECASAGPGACDAPDVCTGTSADCMPTFLSGTECRVSAGGCDPSEFCAGSSPNCPPDAVSPAGTACRVASDPSCDAPEVCDGTATACPLDVTVCVDAGRRDGGPGDDGGVPPPGTAVGCSCRASARGSSGLFGVLVALAVVARRRR